MVGRSVVETVVGIMLRAVAVSVDRIVAVDNFSLVSVAVISTVIGAVNVKVSGGIGV